MGICLDHVTLSLEADLSQNLELWFCQLRQPAGLRTLASLFSELDCRWAPQALQASHVYVLGIKILVFLLVLWQVF